MWKCLLLREFPRKCGKNRLDLRVWGRAKNICVELDGVECQKTQIIHWEEVNTKEEDKWAKKSESN